MKYIDADRLKAEIKKKLNEIVAEALEPDANLVRLASAKYKKDALSDAISIIDSLQQEQESVAERFARIVRRNLIGIDKEVQQKFEQLYFEVTGNKMYGGYND